METTDKQQCVKDDFARPLAKWIFLCISLSTVIIGIGVLCRFIFKNDEDRWRRYFFSFHFLGPAIGTLLAYLMHYLEWNKILRVVILGIYVILVIALTLFQAYMKKRQMESVSDIATVLAVHLSDKHSFSKKNQDSITLLEGLGVEGDAHLGKTVQHLSRIAKDPTVLNYCQVHLIHNELFEEVKLAGFNVKPGDIGENITTNGIDLLSLPVNTKLYIGATAVIQLTGLRNPCQQIERFQPGLLAQVLKTGPDGKLIRKSGVMAVVLSGGVVKPGDEIVTELPVGEQKPLEPI